MRRAIVVGASSGIGKQISRKLASEGYQVFLLARNAEALEQLTAELRQQYGPLAASWRSHDVRDTEAVPGLFRQALDEFGTLDLLVYNSGVQLDTAPDEFDTAKDLTTLQTNLGGAMAWLNEGAKYFQSKRSGTLCAISSVAGDRGRRGYPAYHASKAGLATFMESLWIRLSDQGIKVVTIKPGPIRTPLTEGRADIKGGLFPLEPAVDLMYNAIQSGVREAYVPGKWRWIMLIIQHIPAFLFKKLPI